VAVASEIWIRHLMRLEFGLLVDGESKTRRQSNMTKKMKCREKKDKEKQQVKTKCNSSDVMWGKGKA